MRGIDIASHQAGIRPGSVDADFVIVKVSQGVSYENPFWRSWADEVLSSGKLLGLYHYAAGGSPSSEARFFIDLARDYIGKAILCLDWEEGQNASWGAMAAWTEPWMSQVQRETGVTPFLYVQQSEMHHFGHKWPLWIAQYGYVDEHKGYIDHPWREGTYSCEIRQYSSTGHIGTIYDGHLDINKAYITRDQWNDYAGGDMANAQEIIDILKDTSDPTGRGMRLNDHDHIKWIAAAQAKQGEEIEALKEAARASHELLEKVFKAVSKEG